MPSLFQGAYLEIGFPYMKLPLEFGFPLGFRMPNALNPEINPNMYLDQGVSCFSQQTYTKLHHNIQSTHLNFSFFLACVKSSSTFGKLTCLKLSSTTAQIGGHLSFLPKMYKPCSVHFYHPPPPPPPPPPQKKEEDLI